LKWWRWRDKTRYRYRYRDIGPAINFSQASRRVKPRFEITTETANGSASARIRVAGELDIAAAPDLELAIERRAVEGATLILDLSDVTFIDSTGLAVLIHAATALDGRLRIIASPACQRLIDLTGTRSRLPLVGVTFARP
jgi:anti-sigma B factor antagonist